MSSCEERFEAGIAHLHRYVAAHGSSSPPHGATIDGFRIGSWVDSRRTEYRRGRLSAERIRRIESEFLDWRWNVRDVPRKVPSMLHCHLPSRPRTAMLAPPLTDMITERDSPAVAQAWFQGLNPVLDDRAPALLLREGELADVGPQVLDAARQFAAVG
ncbi:helicase associated domain-containing protein [Gordonia sp. 'Campus']|uniref:helicase associated domain-containing protein n=1 Tax=Gordonia sp. 'Campus' TaxID=2915824 RepID=UPI001EE3E60B|nr:helicase associated domain-containing protein [Gordonia sp. 'Campus']